MSKSEQPLRAQRLKALTGTCKQRVLHSVSVVDTLLHVWFKLCFVVVLMLLTLFGLFLFLCIHIRGTQQWNRHPPFSPPAVSLMHLQMVLVQVFAFQPSDVKSIWKRWCFAESVKICLAGFNQQSLAWIPTHWNLLPAVQVQPVLFIHEAFRDFASEFYRETFKSAVVRENVTVLCRLWASKGSFSECSSQLLPWTLCMLRVVVSSLDFLFLLWKPENEQHRVAHLFHSGNKSDL